MEEEYNVNDIFHYESHWSAYYCNTSEQELSQIRYFGKASNY